MKTTIKSAYFIIISSAPALFGTAVVLASAPSGQDVSNDSDTVSNDSDTVVKEAVFIPPKILDAPEGEYPQRAYEEGIEAEVLLEVDIDDKGRVETVSVLTPAKTQGYGFDEAAVQAVRLFVFEPATEGGVPIPVRITYKYRFTLSAPAADGGVPAEEEAVSDGQETATQEPGSFKQAPKINFKGELLERGTRLPLSGVTVTIFRKDKETAGAFETVTDKDGRFVFFDLIAGAWNVSAESDGYFPLRESDEVEAGKVTEVKYYLERADYNVYDILVEGEKTRKEVSRTSLTVETVEKIPGTAGDVLTVIQNLPGVARTGPVGGDIVVRGSSPEDSEVFVDGVNVPIIYHFGGLRSVIPLGMLDRLDFYPGNFSVQYGRATGGVVDVGLKTLSPEKVGGYLDVNIFDTGALLEAPIGDKAAIAVAGRRSYIDSFLSFVVPDDAPVNLVTAPRYYDYQLLFNARPNEKHELKAFFFGSDDELDILFENPADFSPEIQAQDASTSTSFYRTVLEHEFYPKEKIKNVFKVAAGRNWIYFGVGDQIFLDINSYVAQVRDTLSLKLTDNLTLNGGVDYLFTRADTRIKFPDVSKEGEAGGKPDLSTIKFTEAKNQDIHSVATFLETEVEFFDRLLLVPGLRFDYFSQVDENAFSPRLAARFALTDKWTLKGGVGLFQQEPSFDETSEVFGNPNLHLESAVHYSLGAEFRPLPYLLIDVTGFYKDLNDLVSRTDQTVERDGEIVPMNFNNGGRGRAYGAELLIRHDFNDNFTGWLSYTFSRAERKDFGADKYRFFDYDQTHILTVLGTYNLPKNWSIGARWRLVTGNPETPRQGAVYVVDSGVYEPIYGESNSERMPPFHQLDLRLDKRWVFDNWMLTAYLDIQNVYNRANPVAKTYNYDSTEESVRQSLPIIPIVGIKGEF